MKRMTLLGIALLATVSGTALAFPPGQMKRPHCEYFVPDKVTSGDEWYGPHRWSWCSKRWLKNLAKNYGMNGDDWHGGWGWKDACNTDKPFARVATARHALFASAPDPQVSGNVRDITGRNWINRAGRYASVIIDELDPDCGFGNANAVATYWHNPLDSWIELYLLRVGRSDAGYFYGLNVPARASSLIHEARHWQGCPDHNDRDQDERWEELGAYTVQVLYLWAYVEDAINAPHGLRCSAQCDANAYLVNRFARPTGLYVDHVRPCNCP